MDFQKYLMDIHLREHTMRIKNLHKHHQFMLDILYDSDLNIQKFHYNTYQRIFYNMDQLVYSVNKKQH